MAESIRLFRFMSATAALRTIEKRSFRVGRVLEFNDPFEWRPGFKNHAPEWEFLMRTFQDRLARLVNSDYGVICFSDTTDDPVLWSHYADRHKGMALEVDHLIGDGLFPVVYSDSRPTLDVTKLNPAEMESHGPEVMQRMLAHKSKGWAYEREYRVFADLARCTVSNGNYFSPIPADFLKRVILGFKCEIDEGYVRRSLDLADFKDVAVARASDDIQSFKIRLTEYAGK